MSTTSTATIRPVDAQKLLRTLCNHWRHRFEVERLDDSRARIPFAEFGVADFTVEGAMLSIRVQQPDDAMRERLQDVIASHLRRFERDESLPFDWQAG